MKDWRAKWFYAENVLLALAVHSNARLSANNHWEKETLTLSEMEKIRPFLKEIKALKNPRPIWHRNSHQLHQAPGAASTREGTLRL
jgi:hypothetical protein